MIGRLRGIVAEIGEEEALIDVGGVGYVVRFGSRTLGRLPAIGDETVVHVEHQWSEAQGPRLYGFSTREERSVFVLLQAIQGVGPKAAMAVLDVLPPAELAGAVPRGDPPLVARANGVGPKLAQRIVLALMCKPPGPVPLRGVSGPGGIE
ncbi:MAG: Holliday junction branch migration protein RuvA, partial [Caulobacter sp.]|nr:Holliday junction branch migration protein RuvA [Caulobacter sp.]